MPENKQLEDGRSTINFQLSLVMVIMIWYIAPADTFGTPFLAAMAELVDAQR
ncbi:MAG: hypothetical protein JJ891_17875 [Rhizobiaceae bacterium]|nr:hypothetical protein [Rhizobiaceae bacterium]